MNACMQTNMYKYTNRNESSARAAAKAGVRGTPVVRIAGERALALLEIGIVSVCDVCMHVCVCICLLW
jgi:hypothetical protein